MEKDQRWKPDPGPIRNRLGVAVSLHSREEAYSRLANIRHVFALRRDTGNIGGRLMSTREWRRKPLLLFNLRRGAQKCEPLLGVPVFGLREHKHPLEKCLHRRRPDADRPATDRLDRPQRPRHELRLAVPDSRDRAEQDVSEQVIGRTDRRGAKVTLKAVEIAQQGF